jgi:hypothetical protein
LLKGLGAEDADEKEDARMDFLGLFGGYLSACPGNKPRIGKPICRRGGINPILY